MLWCASAVLLVLGLYANTWRVVDADWFDRHQRDAEAVVVGRLAKSAHDGVFSAGGLLGAGVPDVQHEWLTSAQIQAQYTAYLAGTPLAEYSTYDSQVGGQGVLFGLIDALLPLRPATGLALFHALTALLTACALAAMVAWFRSEFGGWAALAVLASLLLSQWMTVFGRNLYWGMWAFFLPMLGTLHWLRRGEASTAGDGPAPRRTLRFGALVFGLVLLKCLINGYEYMTTTLVMVMVPPVYYAVRDRWSAARFVRCGLVAATASGLAVALTMAVLCVQIGSVKGSLRDGVEHIVFSLGKQTHGAATDVAPIHAEALRARTVDVLETYVRGAYFDADHERFHRRPLASHFAYTLRHYHLIAAFALASLLLLLRSRAPPERRRRHVALVVATWASVLAPLSWYVVFKSHSYLHTHMNHVLWVMPFTLFGFAVCGLCAGRLVPRGRRRADPEQDGAGT